MRSFQHWVISVVAVPTTQKPPLVIYCYYSKVNLSGHDYLLNTMLKEP